MIAMLSVSMFTLSGQEEARTDLVSHHLRQAEQELCSVLETNFLLHSRKCSVVLVTTISTTIINSMKQASG